MQIHRLGVENPELYRRNYGFALWNDPDMTVRWTLLISRDIITSGMTLIRQIPITAIMSLPIPRPMASSTLSSGRDGGKVSMIRGIWLF